MIAAAPPVKEPAITPCSAEMARRQAELVDRVEKTRCGCHRFLVQAIVWTILALLIVGGLLALADYFWILSQTIRLASWVLAGVLVAAIVVRRIALDRRAAFNRLDAAVEIETAFPDLGQRVCTTLEYAEPTPSTMPAWPSMVRALTTETEERTCRLNFEQVIPWHRLRWPLWAAGGLAVLFVVAIAISPSAAACGNAVVPPPGPLPQLKVEPGNQSVNSGAT